MPAEFWQAIEDAHSSGRDFLEASVVLQPDGIMTRESLTEEFMKWRRMRQPLMQLVELDRFKSDLRDFDRDAFRKEHKVQVDGGNDVYQDCYTGYVVLNGKQGPVEPVARFEPDLYDQQCTSLSGFDDTVWTRLDNIEAKLDKLIALQTSDEGTGDPIEPQSAGTVPASDDVPALDPTTPEAGVALLMSGF